jgi:DNA-binding CsgD family transcriptional regulator/tetratricopeptide (TPR) repeat protein
MAWSFVGREEELDLVERYRAEGGRAVVLTGTAGVGKSRLAREALERCSRRGDITRWVQATRSAATVPLGAFSALLPESVRAENQLELLRLGTRSIRGLAGGGLLVLGIDDAHLLDPVSAAMVLELTTEGPVFVIMTIRKGEACPDAVTSVWKDGAAAVVELSALDRPRTDMLTEAIVGGPVEQSARNWVYETSLGNALYASELTKGALTGGALAEVHGMWRMAGRPPVAASLTELITARLTGVPPGSAHALELVSLGEPLPLSEFVDLVGVEALTDVEARGLVAISSEIDPDVSLAHPLFGEVLRNELPGFRRRQLQAELASAIRGRSQISARDLVRMARWLVEAGEEVPVETLVESAGTANLAGDPELASELAQRAVDSGAGYAAVVVLARAYVLQGRYPDAEEILAKAEAQFGSGRESAGLAVEYLELQTTVLYWGLRRVAELQELLARARNWSDALEFQRHLDRLCLIGHDETSPVVAAATSEELYADDRADREVRRRAAPLLAGNLFYRGRVREAYELVREIRPAVPLRDLTDEISFALSVAISLESGIAWPELEDWASRALGDGIRTGDHAAAGHAALALGGLRFSQGRYTEAGRWLAEAELQLEHHDAVGLLAIVNSMQVGVACFTGDLDGMAPALERCLGAVGGKEPLPAQLPYVARAKAWSVLGAGDPPRSQALFLDAAARVSGIPVYEARLTYEAMRAGAPARRLASSLQKLATDCDGPLTAAYAAHATALAGPDPDGLLRASAEMEAIGALRYATEAAAHAATAFATRGRNDSARRAAARCQELHDGCEGAIQPLIEGLEPGAVKLTARERQLVDLASKGLSNAEIADRLVLSIRTVESHLYRAMAKLGVTDRRDLRV